MINGFDVEGRRFVGSSLDWFTPFNLFCGLGLIVAYTLLATTWLIMKSEGALQNRMRELTRHVLLALIAVIAVVSIWTPLGWQFVAERWFTLPNFFWFLPVPVLVAVFSLWIWRLTRNPDSHARPFLLTLGLIFLGFSGSWHQPVATHNSAAHHPVGSRRAACQPAVYADRHAVNHPGDPGLYRPSYYVFRGKVSDTEGYH